MNKTIRLIVTSVISVCAIVACIVAIFFAYNNGSDAYRDNIDATLEQKRSEIINGSTFHSGISVNGINIGGMTFDEAASALSEVEAQLISDVGFTLHHVEGSIELTTNDFDISYDTETVLSDAIMLAREGELEAIRQQVDDIRINGRSYEISCSITPRYALIKSKIVNLSDIINYDAVDASFVPNPDSVYYDPDDYEGLDDPTAHPDYVSPERFIFVEEKTGRRLLSEKAYDEVITRTETRDFGLIELETEDILPAVHLDDIQSSIVLRSHYESSYASGSYGAPNRIYNVKKACSLVNGFMLPPDNPDDAEDNRNVFSTNDCLGDRTEENGWLLAPGFIDGGANSEDSPGGGVCHVSSTLYNAVILADLEIEYRINHSSHVGYVPWGLDATIDTGRIDFIWSNNTEENIYIFMWVDTSKKEVCCEIWGQPFPEEFDSIKFYAELDEVIEIGETQYIETSKLSAPYWYIFNDAKTGYKYKSYKQYYKDGKRVGRPVPVATSEYRMHPQRIYVWKGFDPAVDELLPENRIPKPED